MEKIILGQFTCLGSPCAGYLYTVLGVFYLGHHLLIISTAISVGGMLLLHMINVLGMWG